MFGVCPAALVAQEISWGNNLHDDVFMYEVKLIDEFFERFNDEKTSFLRTEYQKQNKPYNVTRAQLLVSLFNLQNKTWSSADTSGKEFIHFIANPKSPRFIYYGDSNWYAEARCFFTYEKKMIEIPLVFHIVTLPNKGMKWMVAGIGDNPILAATRLGPVTYNTKYESNSFYISTSSDATGFSELSGIFTEGMNPVYYFDPEVMNSDKGRKFIQLIIQGKLSFEYAKDIKYHFYQVDNWIFTVEQFSRTDFNSGWLINSVKRVDKAEKEAIRKKLLHF